MKSQGHLWKRIPSKQGAILSSDSLKRCLLESWRKSQVGVVPVLTDGQMGRSDEENTKRSHAQAAA